MKIIGYCDGSAFKNGKKGARASWGYSISYTDDGIVYEENEGALLEGEVQTNQRAEMTAMIKLCQRATKLRNHAVLFSCEVYSDSAYCINCYEQKWYVKWIKNNWINSKGQKVANIDLWKKLIPFFEDNDFIFKKVKGHSGLEGNERADAIARSYNIE